MPTAVIEWWEGEGVVLREEIEHRYYARIAVAWYASVFVPGVPAFWACWHLLPPSQNGFEFAFALAGVVLVVLAAISPLVVWLSLRRVDDPAAGMTASAVSFLGHILILGGPLLLATPFVGRHVAMLRHESGGF